MLKTFKISGTAKEIYFVFVTFLTYLFSGINRAYLAFLFHQLDCPDTLIAVNDEQKSLLAAFSNLFSPLGCLIAGICMDLIGRRHTVQLVYIPFIASWALITYAENINMLYAAFLCQGIGAGMTFCSTAYISEISTAKYRGSLLVILMINYNIGIFISHYLMYLLPWNMVALIFTGASVFTLMLTLFLPESPTWLYLKGRKEKSLKTLCFIRSKKLSELEFEVQELEIYCTSKEKNSLMKTIKNCITAWRQFLTIILLGILTSNTGQVTMSVYGIMILNQLSTPYENDHLMVIYSSISMFTCLLTPIILHRFPRKNVLSASALGMAICLSMLGTYQQFHEQFTSCTWIIPAVFFTYSFAANLGVGPIAFCTPGELLPNESRGVLSGLCGSVLFLYFATFQKIFPGFLSAFGVITTLYVLSASCILMVLYAIFILPETKGKTLNQIQEEYYTKKK